MVGVFGYDGPIPVLRSLLRPGEVTPPHCEDPLEVLEFQVGLANLRVVLSGFGLVWFGLFCWSVWFGLVWFGLWGGLNLGCVFGCNGAVKQLLGIICIYVGRKTGSKRLVCNVCVCVCVCVRVRRCVSEGTVT